MSDRVDQPSEKRAWHTPEMIDVGGVDEITMAGPGNVRDGANTSVMYRPNTRTPNTADEVDLGTA